MASPYVHLFGWVRDKVSLKARPWSSRWSTKDDIIRTKLKEKSINHFIKLTNKSNVLCQFSTYYLRLSLTRICIPNPNLIIKLWFSYSFSWCMTADQISILLNWHLYISEIPSRKVLDLVQNQIKLSKSSTQHVVIFVSVCTLYRLSGTI